MSTRPEVDVGWVLIRTKISAEKDGLNEAEESFEMNVTIAVSSSPMIWFPMLIEG